MLCLYLCVCAVTGGAMATVCNSDHSRHSVRGGVRQAHHRLHGTVSERPDTAAQIRSEPSHSENKKGSLGSCT